MYHVIHSYEAGCYTVGTGTPGVDWEPVADFLRADEAQADAEERNNPRLYSALNKMQRQIDNLMKRVAELEYELTVELPQAEAAETGNRYE